MYIEKIRLRNFRNYQELELTPHPGVNLLFGQNGSGKTNLLEAIHYCALGRSHRTSQDREVVRKGEAAGACGVTVTGDGGRSEIAVRLMPGDAHRKQVFVDRKRAARLSELMGRVRVVIFSPEDLSLVKEGPSGRRRYADMLLSQLNPPYFVALQQYQKALDQRNAILRAGRQSGALPGDLLDAFEEAMARQCALIIPLRRELIGQVAELAAEKYAGICGRPQERFRMRYQCCAEEADPAEQLRDLWRRQRQEDLLRGVTSSGIHREDIALSLNDREMKLFASQGQIRTAALSMKLAQLELFRLRTGEPPVLLLDDVMSELDMTRRTHLLGELTGVQTFVTCTDESDLDGCADRRAYRVRLDETGCPRVEETREGEAVPVQVWDDEPDFS